MRVQIPSSLPFMKEFEEHIKSLNFGRTVGARDTLALLFMQIRINEKSSLEDILKEVAQDYITNYGDNTHVHHFLNTKRI